MILVLVYKRLRASNVKKMFSKSPCGVLAGSTIPEWGFLNENENEPKIS